VNKKLLITLVIAFCAGYTAVASPRSKVKANEIVRKVQMVSGASDEAPQLVFVKPKVKARAKTDEAYYYVFSRGEGRGFTIVSGDDRMPDVIGYTDSGNYNEQTMPEGLKSVMQAYAAQVDYMDQHGMTAPVKRAATQLSAIAPLIQTEWSQGEPYYNQCPSVNGVHCQTGCVATALAQIINYHKFPAKLKAAIPSYTTATKGITVPEIPATTTFDWKNMLNVYNPYGSTTWTAAQGAAVANLMLCCGAAIEMDYMTDASAADLVTGPLVDCFGYDKDMETLFRRDFDIVQWGNIIYNELKQHRPVFMGGASSKYGHAFVCDGVDSNGLFHINWGWGTDSDNGYYDLSLLNPNMLDSNWLSGGGFNVDNYITIGIQPENNKADVHQGATPSGLTAIDGITCYKMYDSSRTAFSADLSLEFSNKSSLSYSGYAGIGLRNDDGTFECLSYTPTGNLNLTSYLHFERTIGYTKFVDGRSYILYPIESTDAKNWRLMNNALAHSLELTVANNVVTAVAKKNLTAVMTFTGGMCVGYPVHVKATISNPNAYNYYNPIKFYWSKTDQLPTTSKGYGGVFVPAEGSVDAPFQFKPSEAGVYYLWLTDAYGNIICKQSVTIAERPAYPNVTLLSVSVKNPEGTQSGVSYGGKNITVDKVTGTSATFVFKVQNTGGFYEGNFVFYNYSMSDNSFSEKVYHNCVFPANATTEVEYTVHGATGDLVGGKITSEEQFKIEDSTTPPNVYTASDGTTVSLADAALCYLAQPQYVRQVTAGRYGTVCLPYDAIPAAGVKVYSILGRNAEGTYVYVQEETLMTAGKPYLFLSSTSTATFNETAGTEVDAPVDGANGLLGTFDAKVLAKGGNLYVLSNNKWYLVNNDNGFTCGANRAYLNFSNVPVVDGKEAKAMEAVSGGTTGIVDVRQMSDADAVYTLQGVRMSSDKLPRGIYIRGGKKFVVK
jgi:hypothetical protein